MMSFRRLVRMCVVRCCTRTPSIWELPSRSMTRGSLSVAAIGLANVVSTSARLREYKMIKLRWGISGGRRVPAAIGAHKRMHESILIIHSNENCPKMAVDFFFFVFIELSPSISIPKCGNLQSIKLIHCALCSRIGRKRFRVSSEQRLKFERCSFLDIRAQPKRIHSPFPHCNFFILVFSSVAFSFFFRFRSFALRHANQVDSFIYTQEYNASTGSRRNERHYCRLRQFYTRVLHVSAAAAAAFV